MPGPTMITGVSSFLGKVMVPDFTHTGTKTFPRNSEMTFTDYTRPLCTTGRDKLTLGHIKASKPGGAGSKTRLLQFGLVFYNSHQNMKLIRMSLKIKVKEEWRLP